MRALVLDSAGRVRLDADHPEPIPSAHEALVHVRRAGVCATDLELMRGYAGFVGVLGHEFVGLVDPADPELGGRRVVADINVGCGRCPICATSNGHHCPERTTLGIRGRPGVFAQRVAIPRACLVEVPDHVDDDLAVFAEPLAAALHVLDELDERSAQAGPVAVLGDGKLGLLIALALAAAGYEVELIGRHPAKLAIAADAGVTTIIERPGQLRDASPRRALVVEATGSPSGLARALQLAQPRGTIVLKTTTATPTPIDLTPVVVNELRIVGSRCGDMRRAVDLLARGLDLRPLIAATYGLDEAQLALEHAAKRSVLKVLIQV